MNNLVGGVYYKHLDWFGAATEYWTFRLNSRRDRQLHHMVNTERSVGRGYMWDFVQVLLVPPEE